MTGDSSSTQANQGFQREAKKKPQNIYQSDSQECPGRAEQTRAETCSSEAPDYTAKH